jgi:agmatinase
MNKNFDPNAAAAKNSGIFGLPFTAAEAKMVIIPVPWEVTTSYGGGTSQGPQSVFHASMQVDLYDFELGNFYEAGIAMLDESADVRQWNKQGRKAAQKIIDAGGVENNHSLKAEAEKVNGYSEQLNEYVYTQTKNLLAQGKRVGILGGDHSTPFGAIQAFLEKYPHMGILHFDAHADMRNAYEGFEHSHASIMYNVIAKTSLQKLVQVGIRDFCEEELNFIQENSPRVVTFFDSAIYDQRMNGIGWAEICEEIIGHLPQDVYISFDIDGLDPRFCPHTGTPVPGGLDLREALYLIKKIAQSGRNIIGFDLNEVSPGVDAAESSEWDANVGARLLYKLCGWTLKGYN